MRASFVERLLNLKGRDVSAKTKLTCNLSSTKISVLEINYYKN